MAFVAVRVDLARITPAIDLSGDLAFEHRSAALEPHLGAVGVSRDQVVQKVKCDRLGELEQPPKVDRVDLEGLKEPKAEQHTD